MKTPTARRSAALALAFSALSLVPTAGVVAEPLKTPFKAVPPPAKTSKILACRTPPPAPVVTLDVSSIYDQDDDSRSEIDPARYEEYGSRMDAPRRFAQEVVGKAANYTGTDGSKLEDGVCALVWLESWAKGDALSRMATRQSALSSTRLVAGLSVAYLQVRDLAATAGVDDAVIEAWLRRRATGIVAVFDESGARRSNRQNHRYWGGWAVAAAGVAVGDRAFLDWGVESYRIGVCQVTADGALPLELDRRKRARNYHLHAVAPLVMTAELAEANGVDAYSFCGGAIHRLISFTLRSVDDPGPIARLAGERQVPLAMKGDRLRGDVFAWVEPYFKRFPNRAGAFDLKLERPLSSTNLGGRTTDLFEVPRE